MSDPRLPSDVDDRPDPRVLLANERTLLAYSRTALGLVVAGVAIAGSHTAAGLPIWFAGVGLPLIVLGVVVSLIGRQRFARVQRAVEHGESLPSPVAAWLLPLGIALVGVLGLTAALVHLAT